MPTAKLASDRLKVRHCQGFSFLLHIESQLLRCLAGYVGAHAMDAVGESCLLPRHPEDIPASLKNEALTERASTEPRCQTPEFQRPT